ncbi:MAG: inositol-3-phosphate synthase, partial [Nitrososphaeraceae archaeon]
MSGNTNKDHKKVKVAIAGVGNCASALLQGISFYGNSYTKGNERENVLDIPEGLIAYTLGNIRPGDIEFVAAFDVVESKVGHDLADAIFASPNNTIKIADVPSTGINVQKGKVLDGVGKRLNERVKISDSPPADVSKVLKESGAEILVNYLPVGSREATKYYVEQCLDAGVSFINAIPVFIASTPKWQQAFTDKNLLCA